MSIFYIFIYFYNFCKVENIPCIHVYNPSFSLTFPKLFFCIRALKYSSLSQCLGRCDTCQCREGYLFSFTENRIFIQYFLITFPSLSLLLPIPPHHHHPHLDPHSFCLQLENKQAIRIILK